jgi:hypothetical protein
MCKIEVENQINFFNKWIFSTIITALALSGLALFANLSFWSAGLAVSFMVATFVAIVNSSIWIEKLINDELPKLYECLLNHKKDCLPHFDKLKYTLNTLKIVLYVTSGICFVGIFTAWIPYWGAIGIGLTLVMIGICLGFAISIITDLYDKLKKCVS